MTPTATGAAARTQELATYDSMTRTFTGTKSRARFSIDPLIGKTSITGTYRLIVTPTVGDPYYYDTIIDYPAVFPTTDIVFNYPWTVGATVYLDRWAFTYQQSAYDDFERSVSVDAEFYTIDPSSAWSQPARSVAPAPNADALDDFELATNLDENGLMSIVTGRGWADAGRALPVDPIECTDDFELYPTGVTIEIMTHGTGWASFGYCVVFDFENAYDEFESYTTGVTLTVLAGGTGWDGDGRAV